MDSCTNWRRRHRDFNGRVQSKQFVGVAVAVRLCLLLILFCYTYQIRVSVERKFVVKPKFIEIVIYHSCVKDTNSAHHSQGYGYWLWKARKYEINGRFCSVSNLRVRVVSRFWVTNLIKNWKCSISGWYLKWIQSSGNNNIWQTSRRMQTVWNSK